MKTAKQIIGERIASKRKSMKMNAKEMADHLGISKQLYSLIENGKKGSVESVMRVCAQLSINVTPTLKRKLAL